MGLNSPCAMHGPDHSMNSKTTLTPKLLLVFTAIFYGSGQSSLLYQAAHRNPHSACVRPADLAADGRRVSAWFTV